MKRSGMTLMEVLMSLFIMGIGMLGVLAIFPAAADMMGRAIANSQIAEGLVNARALYDGVDWMSDPYISSDPIDSFVKTPLPVPNGSPLPRGWEKGNPAQFDSPIYLFLDQAAAMAGLNTLGTIQNSIITKTKNASVGDINGRFFTLNSDVVLNDAGLAVPVDREGKFTLAHFFMKPYPISAPWQIRRHILLFKDRSQSPVDYTSLIVHNLKKVETPTTLKVTGNPGGILKPRHWLMVVANNPDIVEFVEIKAVHEGPSSPNNVEIEVSPPMTVDLKPGRLKGVYHLQDVIRVVLVGN